MTEYFFIYFLSSFTLAAVITRFFTAFLLSLSMRQLVKVLHTHTHARTYSSSAQHTPTSWFCGASFSHVVRLFAHIYSPNQESGVRIPAPNKRPTNVLSSCISREGAEIPQTVADWVRSLLRLPPAPPPPEQPSAGQRHKQNERSVCCFRLFTCGLMGATTGVRVCCDLTVVTFLDRGRTKMHGFFSPPAVCPRSLFRLSIHHFV